MPDTDTICEYMSVIQFIGFMQEHQVKPVIHSEFALDSAIAAIEALMAGKQVGKIVVVH